MRAIFVFQARPLICSVELDFYAGKQMGGDQHEFDQVCN